jgi:hypothetical protein
VRVSRSVTRARPRMMASDKACCGHNRICRPCKRLRIGEPHETDAKENSHSRRSDEPDRDEVEQRSKILLHQSAHGSNPVRPVACHRQGNATDGGSLTSIARFGCFSTDMILSNRTIRALLREGLRMRRGTADSCPPAALQAWDRIWRACLVAAAYGVRRRSRFFLMAPQGDQ